MSWVEKYFEYTTFSFCAGSPARLPASLNRLVFMHLINRLRSHHTRAFSSKMVHKAHAFSCAIDMHSCALRPAREKVLKIPVLDRDYVGIFF
ncbi:hypothetical protein BW76_09795 [Escherichia coli O28ac:NM str. 02-3404]|nr:hypothetical protein BW76_09795 [Escherichia coli O28ac:NM str. 02-3404]OKW17117.1 hypothetical protein AWP70_20400 [Escherichia coli]